MSNIALLNPEHDFKWGLFYKALIKDSHVIGFSPTIFGSIRVDVYRNNSYYRPISLCCGKDISHALLAYNSVYNILCSQQVVDCSVIPSQSVRPFSASRDSMQELRYILNMASKLDTYITLDYDNRIPELFYKYLTNQLSSLLK